MTDPRDHDLYVDEWDLEPEPLDGSTHPPWRRTVLIVVAVVTAVAMAMVPLYNLIDGGEPAVADNGLEVCGFDYCIVQDAVREAGLDLEMARLANTYLSDEQAAQLAALLTEYLGEPPVGFEVVDRLDRRIEGQYDPAARVIYVERPARAWIVLHEVAHTARGGHDAEFQQVVIELTRWLSDSGG